jgi:hypothetical protein
MRISNENIISIVQNENQSGFLFSKVRSFFYALVCLIIYIMLNRIDDFSKMVFY